MNEFVPVCWLLFSQTHCNVHSCEQEAVRSHSQILQLLVKCDLDSDMDRSGPLKRFALKKLIWEGHGSDCEPCLHYGLILKVYTSIIEISSETEPLNFSKQRSFFGQGVPALDIGVRKPPSRSIRDTCSTCIVHKCILLWRILARVGSHGPIRFGKQVGVCFPSWNSKDTSTSRMASLLTLLNDESMLGVHMYVEKCLCRILARAYMHACVQISKFFSFSISFSGQALS